MPPDIKEPGFLCFAGRSLPQSNPAEPYPDMWKSAVINKEAYASLFSPAGKNQVTGEATPEYLYLADQTIATIRSEYGKGSPGPKLVAVLRNPVDRLWSHYWMCRRDNYESLPFEEATDTTVIQRRLDSGWHPQYDYVGYGFYAEAIRAYRMAFGTDHMKVFLLEDLNRDPQTVCAEIFDFLGVDPGFKPDMSLKYNISGRLRHPRLHSRLFCKESVLKDLARKLVPYEELQRIKHKFVAWNSEKIVMPDSLRQKLWAIYRQDVQTLEELLGRDLGMWQR
jgi:hypothetical protein